jgi:hypothetical protein
MKELLEEEDKDAAAVAAVSQIKTQVQASQQQRRHHSHAHADRVSHGHTGVHGARVYEGRAVNESGLICFRACCPRNADWIAGLLTGSRSPQLA